MVLSELVELGPCIPAETVKACALIGLHMMAEENALRLDGDSCPKLRDMWRYGCPKSPVWSSVGDEWARSEGTSSFEDYEHNVDNLALEVVGQIGQVVSPFLEDWELGRVALSCHMAMDILCQEMRDACWVSSNSQNSPLSLFSQNQSSSLVLELSQQRNLFSQHGRSVTFEERDVLGEMVWEWVVKAPCVSFWIWVGLSESFDICHSLNMVCLLQNEGVPSVRLCPSLFCVLFRRSKRSFTTFRKLCGHDRKVVSLTFDVCTCEGDTEFFFGARLSSVGQSDWHWWRLFSSWATKHRLKAFKNQKKKRSG